MLWPKLIKPKEIVLHTEKRFRLAMLPRGVITLCGSGNRGLRTALFFKRAETTVIVLGPRDLLLNFVSEPTDLPFIKVIA